MYNFQIQILELFTKIMKLGTECKCQHTHNNSRAFPLYHSKVYSEVAQQ